MFVNFAPQYLTQIFHGVGKTLVFKIDTLVCKEQRQTQLSTSNKGYYKATSGCNLGEARQPGLRKLGKAEPVDQAIEFPFWNFAIQLTQLYLFSTLSFSSCQIQFFLPVCTLHRGNLVDLAHIFTACWQVPTVPWVIM